MKNENTVLVLARKEDPQLAKLHLLPHVVGGEAADFADAAKDASVILNWTGSRELLRTVFAMCSKLRWVHSRYVGMDNLLFPELVESSVVLTNGRGVYSASLGEFALGVILYFAKDFRRMLRSQAEGRWEPFDVEEIQGQTAGIVGYGDIGRAVAERARPMGMRVVATKRHTPDGPDPLPDPLVERFYRPEELCELLACCDYVVVAAPLTEETRHMISDRELAAMKPTAVVINVGRGPVIDQEALVRALTAKRIKGAGLDVCEHEPLPAGDPLYRLENVLLSPHCADHTATWMDQAMCLFLEQYRRFENKEPLKNIVNKQLGY